MPDAARIVIVEDEPEMAALLVQAFSESGYNCVSASNGVEGLALSRNADLMLVDVMMPTLNGFMMVEELRREGSRVPVLYLSAKDQTKDIVRGFESGGDDYLVKPFKLEELLARVKAILRRSRDLAQILVWGDIRLDVAARTVSRDGHELFLSGTEFQLLELFLRSPGEILSKKVLLRKIWADEGYRDDNIVELYINYLRRKTEAHSGSRVIQTLRGKGYVLALAVEDES